MNQGRALYDENIMEHKNVMSTKSVKYVTDTFGTNRSLRESAPESISVSSQLRMQPTRLNYIDRPETELFGTAPYKTLGHRCEVDTESMLRNGDTSFGCLKVVEEETWPNQDFINAPLVVDSAVRPTSTLVNIRNQYCNIPPRK